MDLENPTFVTESGTRLVVEASPDGLVIRTRTANGAESGGSIPADAAIEILNRATDMIAALTVTPG